MDCVLNLRLTALLHHMSIVGKKELECARAEGIPFAFRYYNEAPFSPLSELPLGLIELTRKFDAIVD